MALLSLYLVTATIAATEKRNAMTVNDKIIGEINEYARHPISNEGEKIFRAILTRGFVTAKDVGDEVLPGISSSSLYRALRRLATRKLIEPLRMSDVGVLGWRLNRALQERFSYAVGFAGAGQYRLQATRDLHDRIVRKVANRLSMECRPHFIAHEGMIRSHLLTSKKAEYSDLKNLVPDLILGSKKENGEVVRTAIEVELSQKGKQRRRAVFEKKLSCREWKNIVYILGPETDLSDHYSAARFAVQTSPRISKQFPFNPILFIPIQEFHSNGLDAKGRVLGGEKTLRTFLSETGIPGDLADAGR